MHITEECVCKDRSKNSTLCDRHKCCTLSVTGTEHVSVSVENPDRNGSKVKRSNGYLTHTKDVSFAEYPLFYRALLHKRPVILRSLLIVATPYY